MILVVSTGRSLGIPEEILEVSLSPGVKSYLECSTTFRCIMAFIVVFSISADRLTYATVKIIRVMVLSSELC